MTADRWDPQYDTGIASIDGQHRAIFQAARDLQGAIHTGHEHEAASRVLNLLVRYCRTHFESEETHMERAGFPGLAAHRELHRSLMDQVHGMVERYAAGDSRVALDLAVLVTHWLKKHILEQDQLFVRHLRDLDSTRR